MNAPNYLKSDEETPCDSRDKKARPRVRIPIPEALEDVALIDARTSASCGGMGLSWWLAEVRCGRAPAPVIREPRCTRWAVTSVRSYWAKRAQGGIETSLGAEVIGKAKKASAAAQVKRRAQVFQATSE
jgi:hypothetical protein